MKSESSACERHSQAKDRVEVEFHLVDGFKQMNQNKFIDMPKHDSNGKLVGVTPVPVGKWWLSHPNRREYRDVVFYPNHDFPDSMNLWRGFAVNAVPGECGRFLDHIRDVLCKGNKRYRYYTCTTVIKKGSSNCPAGSLPAAEIEDVVEQIRCIGQDEGLRAEVLKQTIRTGLFASTGPA